MSVRLFLKNLATFFGIGFSPYAPGTMGTLATIPIAAMTMYLGPFVHMGVCVLLLPISILAATVYQQDKAGHDHSEIVIDEVIGFLITVTWLPLTWQTLAFGFVIFRFLDIVKPFPISYLDKNVKGGVGVVIDDVAAGLVGNILLQVIYNKTDWLGVTAISSSFGF